VTPLVVIRPEPGCSATIAAARTLGLDARGYPLFEVRPVAWDAPPRESFDALLLGSANALRHSGKTLEQWRGLPAYAVGETTAAAARDLGLEVVATGEGGLQLLLRKLAPEHRRLLRLAGRERVPLVAPEGTTIAECIIYASEALPMPAGLAEVLAGPALVLLHSAEAARHFARLIDAAGIARNGVALAALGPRIAAAAGEGWRSVNVAPVPTDAALLALAKEICHTPAPDEGNDTTDARPSD